MSAEERVSLQTALADMLAQYADDPGAIFALKIAASLALDVNRIADKLTPGGGGLFTPAQIRFGEMSLASVHMVVLRDALDIAYIDDDAPIYDDPARAEALKELARALGCKQVPHDFSGGIK